MHFLLQGRYLELKLRGLFFMLRLEPLSLCRMLVCTAALLVESLPQLLVLDSENSFLPSELVNCSLVLCY